MDFLFPVRTLRALFRRARLRSQRGPIMISSDPVMPPDADAWLRAAIARARFYVEFGSGGSTVLASSVGVPTISVESDPDFAAEVERALVPGAPVLMIRSGIGWTEEWGYPVVTLRTPYRLRLWRRYTELVLDEIERRGQFPDLVLIDGRFRRACALAIAGAADASGASVTVLFDDYAGREHYHRIEAYLGVPQLISRAAVFQISPGSLLMPINEAVLREAHADYR
jgi:hypothetical protein